MNKLTTLICLALLSSVSYLGAAAADISYPRDAKGEVKDEDYKALWFDTSAPEGRTENDWRADMTSATETVKGSKAEIAAYYDKEQEKATSKSIESNAAWLKNAKNVDVGKAVYPGKKVKLGNEVLFENPKYHDALKGKRVGLITNPSGCDSQFVSTIDKLMADPDIELTALFAPEHGVRGAERAGDGVKDGIDPVTGVPVYSLHGKDKDKISQSKPRPSMLANVDVLMFDIQDTGNRSYTYSNTMRLGMQAAYENGKEFWILDRPNPLGGNLVSGNVADKYYMMSVCWGPVAYIHGLTPGEIGMLFNDVLDMKTNLKVVPMEGWTRSMKWQDTGLPWVPTSTHNQSIDAVWGMAITGEFGELHSTNVGVGYPAPFQYVGAPWIDSMRLAQELNSRGLEGIFFKPAYYRPFYHIYKDELCGGVQLIITDYDKIMPVEASLNILEALNTMYPEQRIMYAGAGSEVKTQRARVSMFNKVMGGPRVRDMLLEGKSAKEIIADWAPARDKFAKDREKYFLYK